MLTCAAVSTHCRAVCFRTVEDISLSNRIPSSLGQLNVETFSVQNTNISGIIPYSFSSLAATALLLSHNKLTVRTTLGLMLQ